MDENTKLKLAGGISVEQNKATTERAIWNSKEMKEMRESVKTRLGFDMKDEKAFPVMSPDFSWKKAGEKVMRETNSASSFPQLLRAGVQTMVNNLYQTVPVTYDAWAKVVASSRDTELYAPLHGLSFPSEVGANEKYIESLVAGLDLKLKNRKFGEIFPVEMELINDDQTGQFQQQVSLMAEYARQIVEVYCYGKLASVAGMSYSNLRVPVSETKPATEAVYPWTSSAAPFVGGGFNRPVAFGGLTQANIQAGFIALMDQKNLLGLKMNVDADTIVIGPHYKFDLGVLLNSSYYPSGAAAAGVVGGAFSTNMLQGIAKPIVSRFIFDNAGSVNADSKAWYLMDTKKPWFVAQLREAASVTQENPESGESFDRDVLRWKLRTRMNCDFIDPRFAWQGSDGSV